MLILLAKECVRNDDGKLTLTVDKLKANYQNYIIIKSFKCRISMECCKYE